MVIMSTSAEEVSIQAVSPELMSVNFMTVGSVGAAGAAAAAGAAVASADAAAAGTAGASSANARTGCVLTTRISTKAASAAVIARALEHPYCLAFRSTRITCNSHFF